MKQHISNLKMSRKFMLIALLGLAMVALPAWLAIRHELAALHMAKAEADGVARAGDVLKLIQFTQQHRALSAMVLGGATDGAGAREGKARQVELA
ncbi:MAG TPA: hypothetical protein VJ743_20815, partial [Albitalea sp.]|nr:hypothetical protein [Albitalea sp.]